MDKLKIYFEDEFIHIKNVDITLSIKNKMICLGLIHPDMYKKFTEAFPGIEITESANKKISYGFLQNCEILILKDIF